MRVIMCNYSGSATIAVYPRLLKASIRHPAVMIVSLAALVRYIFKYAVTFGLARLLRRRVGLWPGLAGVLLGVQAQWPR